MNCKVYWEWNFVEAVMKTKFKRVYKAHVGNVLFRRDSKFLEQAQREVNAVERNKHLDVKKRELREEIRKLQSEIRELDSQKQKNGNFTIVAKCIACPGYLDESWHCVNCKITVCSECRVVIQDADDHVCDPDTVKTISLLLADSKPCPGCGEVIHKVDGCQQMWCTKCHVAFDWGTGKIETVIHNPHYLEWAQQQQQLPRQEGDVLCGRVLDYRFCNDLKKKLNEVFQDPYTVWPRYNRPPSTFENFGSGFWTPPTLEEVEAWVAVHKKILSESELKVFEAQEANAHHARKILEICFYVHNYGVVINDRFREISNDNIRREYIRGNISEEAFKAKLQQRHVQNTQLQEIRETLYTTYACLGEILYRLRRLTTFCKKKYGNSLKTDVDVIEMAGNILHNHVHELQQLRAVMNERFVEIARNNGGRYYELDAEFCLHKLQ
jgi:hypothetical protein